MLVQVYAATDVSRAHLAKGLLEEAGIPVTLTNAELQNALGELPPGFATSPKLLVPEEHAERARSILEAIEAA